MPKGTLRDRLNRLRRDIGLYGLYDAGRLNAIPLSNRLLVERVLRRTAMPSLYRFLVDGTRFHCSAASLVSTIQPTWPGTDLAAIEAEFRALMNELQARYDRLKTSTTNYPQEWAIEPEASLLLYSAVRLTRPQLVIETGVANGQSTFLILRALRENEAGRCVSIDLSDTVGGLLTEQDRSDWQLKVLGRSRARRDFSRVIAEFSNIDVFVHDSEHTYSWQTFEYQTIFQRLSPTGILISDDVDSSYAFLDFCRFVDRSPAILLGRTKALGMLTSAS